MRGKLRGDQAPAAPIGKSPDTARSRGTHFGRHNQDTKDGDLAAPSGAYRHRVRQRGADNPRCTMADPDDDELRALFTDDTPPQGWLAGVIGGDAAELVFCRLGCLLVVPGDVLGRGAGRERAEAEQ